MGSNDRVRKLRWLCRRGMKELDILLERFLDSNQDALSQGAWPDMEALLQSEDDWLWDNLQNPEEADDSGFGPLLSAIRQGYA